MPKKAKQPPKSFKINKKGVTLIEVMLATAIMTVGISGIISSYAALTTLSNMTNDISLATRVATGKLEDLRGASIQQIKDDYINNPAVFSPKEDDLFPGDIRYQNLDYRGIIYVEEDATYSDLIEVTVIICWQQGGRVIGEDWVFEDDADPSDHARPFSPVTIITLMTDR